MPVLLFLLWLVFSERISVDVIVVGLIAAALVTLFLAVFTGWSVKRDLQFASKIPAFIVFVIRLIGAVIVANVHIIALVLSDKPNEKIRPRIVAHKTKIKTATGKVTLANSITLTPGTITVDVGEDTLYVHAIDDRSYEGLCDNPLERHIERMEGRT